MKKLKKIFTITLCLIPFMLVAGTHFREDLSDNDGPWKTAFEEKGISVSVEINGIGYYNEIIDIFRKHVEDALDIIPYCYPEVGHRRG